MSIAVYPGSFDPITNGHLDVIKRTAAIFDKVVIGILVNQNKKPLFSLEERTEMIRRVTADIPNIEVYPFSGLVVEFAKEHNVNVLIRGIRSTTDFEYELQMAQINHKIDGNIDTLFFATDPRYSFVSSSAVKELWSYRQDVREYVPEYVIQKLQEKESEK
ncbi:MAG TPA: pantetheine-phosphate adenylyltransferase [Candidatus Fimousia stercorigallinarum]|nr:pantetheine-phosphate adenylyltransferase [Candidatus Fimousia stercorigallinarum]